MQRNRRWRTASIRNGGCPTEVIEMGMSQPDIGDAPTSLLCRLQDQMAVPGRVDGDGFFAAGSCDEIRIGLRGTQRKLNNFQSHAGGLYFGEILVISFLFAEPLLGEGGS
jgi:hypothetical protein